MQRSICSCVRICSQIESRYRDIGDTRLERLIESSTSVGSRLTNLSRGWYDVTNTSRGGSRDWDVTFVSSETEICLSGFNTGTWLFFSYLVEICILKRNMPIMFPLTSRKPSDVARNCCPFLICLRNGTDSTWSKHLLLWMSKFLCGKIIKSPQMNLSRADCAYVWTCTYVSCNLGQGNPIKNAVLGSLIWKWLSGTVDCWYCLMTLMFMTS